MKILIDIRIEKANAEGFIKIIKTTAEIAVDASGAFCDIVNIKVEKPEIVRI